MPWSSFGRQASAIFLCLKGEISLPILHRELLRTLAIAPRDPLSNLQSDSLRPRLCLCLHLKLVGLAAFLLLTNGVVDDVAKSLLVALLDASGLGQRAIKSLLRAIASVVSVAGPNVTDPLASGGLCRSGCGNQRRNYKKLPYHDGHLMQVGRVRAL